MDTCKLFISFTGTLAAMSKGMVRPEDFDNALFYFGCVREHAFQSEDTPSPDYNTYPSGDIALSFRRVSYEAMKLMHEELKAALVKAEAERRVEWRVLGQANSFRQLNAMLQAWEVGPLRVPDEDDDNCYSYPRVEQLATEQEPRLIVIW